MKKLIMPLFLLMVSCSMNDKEESIIEKENDFDVEVELVKIEESRSAFQLAIKEGRPGDLKNYGIDVIASDPDCGPWAEFKELRRNPKGKFNYDSLVMRPRETVIVSDSIAYDFGTSSTYYTNEQGEPVEIIATFLAIMKKDKRDGVWKLHREVGNTRDLE
ncbi:Cif family virulence factor [Algoriphagus halophilus]|uniref:DUF4440 domain-containing protein n=1 Tax=Algoriphagus halophilus TaxID=226505 RepID=A0A1N6D3D6_9BACT|nr:nuclear transport factor 2 family protein [Algoriphagus halophilus]SIN65295.1 hypothetical protein SAMN05444394_0110 [Algoriphagus halophilus]